MAAARQRTRPGLRRSRVYHGGEISRRLLESGKRRAGRQRRRDRRCRDSCWLHRRITTVDDCGRNRAILDYSFPLFVTDSYRQQRSDFVPIRFFVSITGSFTQTPKDQINQMFSTNISSGNSV